MKSCAPGSRTLQIHFIMLVIWAHFSAQTRAHLLTKYQEWYRNGTKSKELLIQRAYVIERSWDKKGFPQKTNKHELESYSFPKKKSKKNTKDTKSIQNSIPVHNSRMPISVGQ